MIGSTGMTEVINITKVTEVKTEVSGHKEPDRTRVAEGGMIGNTGTGRDVEILLEMSRHFEEFEKKN